EAKSERARNIAPNPRVAERHRGEHQPDAPARGLDCDPLGDEIVGVKRKVRPMLLDRADRKNSKRIGFGELLYFGQARLAGFEKWVHAAAPQLAPVMMIERPLISPLPRRVLSQCAAVRIRRR